MKGKVYFVSGIDTDAGKSYATGFLARTWAESGLKVMTMKMIQTGCAQGLMSEDIAVHRRVMGIGLQPEDMNHTTCPIRLRYPASPDMAARLDGVKIDMDAVDRAIERLAEGCDRLLVEGAGGVLVPICGEYTMADYAAQRRLPLILVTNPRLGSVNHTLLSLEACRARGVEVCMVVYNLHLQTSPEITADTRRYLRHYLAVHHPGCEFVEVPDGLL